MTLLQPSRMRLFQSTAWNLLGLGLPLVLALLCIPILIRNLGVERFGMLAVIWALIGYAGLFDLGFGRALTRSISTRLRETRHDEAWEMFLAGTATMLGCGVGWGLLLFIGSSDIASRIAVSADLGDELVSSIRLMALVVPLTLVGSALNGALEAISRFDRSNACRMTVAAITFLGATLASFSDPNLLLAAISLPVARVVSTIMGSCFVLSGLGMRFMNVHVPYGSQLIEFLKESKWISLASILRPVLGYGDRLALLFFVSATTVAYYVTPYEIITKVTILSSAVTTTLFPAFSAAAADSARSRLLLYRGTAVVAIAVAPVVIIAAALSHDALAWWINPTFALESAFILQVLCIGVFFNSIAAMPFAYLQGSGRARLVGVVHIFELPIYVIALYYASESFGVAGVAVAWSARMVFDALALGVASLAAFNHHTTPATGEVRNSCAMPD